MRGLHGLRVEFHPAGIRQLDEAARGAGQTLEVGLRELHALLLPLGGDAEPVNAAALDDELRLELARREEEALEGGVAQELGVGGGSPSCRRGR